MSPKPSDPPAASKPSPAETVPSPATGGELALVATPIGNLGDLTRRAADYLQAADCIACEDSRVTLRLLQHLGLKKPLIVYHDHNAEEMRPQLMERLQRGEKMALVSDAGTPLISDPGFKLVRAAAAAGIRVTALPGPSAPIMALILSGLPSDRFLFLGFLPPRSTARRGELAEVAQVRASLILFETAPRLVDALEDLLAVLGDRPAAVARELTKMFEEVRRGPLSELAAHYREAGPPRGEIVLVVGPPAAAVPADAADLDAALGAALAKMRVKEAAEAVAAALGLPRRQVYQRALELKEGGD
ncbi:16S rRNA (cytidine1402-2'-O)-methyltransferase [Dongia mobilis]|uniref:Ribosomal RNA small subunit methyltransferase I n=1 Tax=Dongia mobilis TaxID=578943 RepID=A0A4R6WX28_9PROT|nr:16S rRNA (cytidine(1402)-2'-O)-methyltransferase [Dongia mobilis]TDQ86354.1 16S rRNA (cytidine1402-2'-O)-methyltransferase [Dongia mobilis]